jgi:MFS-type transporter involved in bile tolerance (Atg22 family)
MNAANFLGRFIPNQLAHRLGVHNQMIVAGITCGSVAIAFIGMHDAVGVILIALVYGFGIGACESLISSDVYSY